MSEIDVSSVVIDGVEIVNVTPHPISFQDLSGALVVVPCSGIVINAKCVDAPAGKRGLAEFVTPSFLPDPTSEPKLAALEDAFPHAVIVGSVIAAQGFRGRVSAMTPAPGFERVAPADKRMNPRKFSMF